VDKLCVASPSTFLLRLIAFALLLRYSGRRKTRFRRPRCKPTRRRGRTGATRGVLVDAEAPLISYIYYVFGTPPGHSYKTIQICEKKGGFYNSTASCPMYCITVLAQNTNTFLTSKKYLLLICQQSISLAEQRQ